MNEEEQLSTAVTHNSRGSDWMREMAGLTSTQIVNAYANQPVCPRCEGLAFRDKGWKANGIATCPSCGWHGKTVTYDEYITNKLYR